MVIDGPLRMGMNISVAMSSNVSQRVEHYQPESAKSHLEPNESELSPVGVGVCAPIGAFWGAVVGWLPI